MTPEIHRGRRCPGCKSRDTTETIPDYTGQAWISYHCLNCGWSAKNVAHAWQPTNSISRSIKRAWEKEAQPAIAATIWRDVLQLAEDYIDPERTYIAAMPFSASLDQLMIERYGVTEPVK